MSNLSTHLQNEQYKCSGKKSSNMTKNHQTEFESKRNLVAVAWCPDYDRKKINYVVVHYKKIQNRKFDAHFVEMGKIFKTIIQKKQFILNIVSNFAIINPFYILNKQFGTTK